jgi:ketosteroid isomerase-like protein
MSESKRQRENLRIVRDALSAWERGDLEAVRAVVPAEAEITSDAMGVNTGIHRGFDGLFTWTGEWLGAFEDWSQELRTAEPVGARHVLVDVHQSGKGAGSGVPVEMDLVYMFEIADGQLMRFHLYPDIKQARAAAEQGERGDDE